jgi:hypothetical protein
LLSKKQGHTALACLMYEYVGIRTRQQFFFFVGCKASLADGQHLALAHPQKVRLAFLSFLFSCHRPDKRLQYRINDFLESLNHMRLTTCATNENSISRNQRLW